MVGTLVIGGVTDVGNTSQEGHIAFARGGLLMANLGLQIALPHGCYKYVEAKVV